METNRVRDILYKHYGYVIPYLYKIPVLNPPEHGIMPKGAVTVADSNLGHNAARVDPILLYRSIDSGGFNLLEALRLMENWEFRQFCRNWNPMEVLDLSHQLERVTRYYAPPSENEKLIAMYFVQSSWEPREEGNADEGDYVPVHDTIHRMRELMRYRSMKFVKKLFAVYELEANRVFFHNNEGHYQIMRDVEEREHYEGGISDARELALHHIHT
jgi:hypothetical protein